MRAEEAAELSAKALNADIIEAIESIKEACLEGKYCTTIVCKESTYNLAISLRKLGYKVAEHTARFELRVSW